MTALLSETEIAELDDLERHASLRPWTSRLVTSESSRFGHSVSLAIVESNARELLASPTQHEPNAADVMFVARLRNAAPALLAAARSANRLATRVAELELEREGLERSWHAEIRASATVSNALSERAAELRSRVKELEEERRTLGEAWHVSPGSQAVSRSVFDLLNTIEAETRGGKAG